MSCVVHWFRNDLRVSDNPALLAEVEEKVKTVLGIRAVNGEGEAESSEE